MLFSDEKRCPRCGASLHDDRREHDRRILDRRQGPAYLPPEGEERRTADRRHRQRRVKGN
jgi:hypothetical protein